jgi:uncharacterized protein (TIGR03435 family)
MQTRLVQAFLLAFSIAVGASGQAGRPSFEVASIRLHPPDGGPLRVSMNTPPGRISYSNATLKACIHAAYGVDTNLISGGPEWLASERYDINAKAASEVSHEELMRMLQTLLEERFQLQVHRESKEIPVYAMVVAKNGLKIHPVAGDGASEISGGEGHLIVARRVSMPLLAKALTQQSRQQLGRPIQDMTGVPGLFDITLDYAPDQNSDDAAGQSIFTALADLGLKLEPRTAPAELLIVDRAAKPTAN